jgi:hypothetical protein
LPKNKIGMDNNIRRILKLFWLVSILVFLFVLLYSYAGYPENVAIFYNKSGFAELFISKSNIFYIGLGLFVLVNGVFLAFGSTLEKLNSWTETKKIEVSGWINGFLLFFNLFLVVSLGFIGTVNGEELQKINAYGSLVIGGIVLIFLWLLYLAYILLKPASLVNPE